MAYRIKITETFEDSSKQKIKWLRREWSDTSAMLFQEKLLTTIVQIVNHPTSGRISARYADVRSARLTKYNRLYYRIFGSTVTLLELIDSKQNPQNNSYE